MNRQHAKEIAESLHDQIFDLELEKKELRHQLEEKTSVISHKLVMQHLFRLIALGAINCYNPDINSQPQQDPQQPLSRTRIDKLTSVEQFRKKALPKRRGRSHSPCIRPRPRRQQLNYGKRLSPIKQVIEVEKGRVIHKG